MCDRRYPEETEIGLVERLRNGQWEAFDGLFEKHRRAVLAYVAGMLRDAGGAEDVVQECFMELARHVGEIDPARGVRPWLFRVARHRAIDRLRRRREQVLSDLDGSAFLLAKLAGGASPADEVMEKERAADVRRALNLLDARDRDLLMLRFYGDLTFREIADVMRRPLGTILWRFPRALERLRRKLTPEG